MNSPVIEVENLGKLYRLGQVGTGTLSHDLKRWWAVSRGKPDPYAKVGKVNDRTAKTASDDYVWALRDISFTINAGDVIGIVGRNGAGKSTLLKILSRITAPSLGEARMRGRIGSLLEVGTGFHPEMTGRENVYMNGTILGMRKDEISKKFDEIIAFAGVEMYVDTPVKRYSSGMMIRLGFAVAAFLEPEILIVDEVLAVGDSEFQKKALGRMQDVSKQEGRTVLFVSHNTGAVRSLCTRGLWLDKGQLQFAGSIDDTLRNYLENPENVKSFDVKSGVLGKEIINGFSIDRIEIVGKGGSRLLVSGDEMNILIAYRATRKFVNPAFVLQFKDIYDVELLRLSNMPISGYQIDSLFETGEIRLRIDRIPFVKGRFTIDLGLVRERVEWHFRIESIVSFEVEGGDVYNSGFELDGSRGLIWTPHKWDHQPRLT